MRPRRSRSHTRYSRWSLRARSCGGNRSVLHTSRADKSAPTSNQGGGITVVTVSSITFDEASEAPAPPLEERPLIGIQARTGSTRLPGKTIAKLGSQTVLEWVVQRARAASLHSGVFVLTSSETSDDVICEVANYLGVECVRGSEDDVLSRFMNLLRLKCPPAVVRITADCPFVDPKVIDAVIKAWWHQGNRADYASNTLKRTFPDGLDVEVVSTEALARVNSVARGIHREHVTSYITAFPESFRCISVELNVDCSWARVTLDTAEDLQALRHMAKDAPHPLKGPRLREILAHFGCCKKPRDRC
ncbi:MAG: hypothetical protein C4317_02935 [Acidimicrobiia bacterium]